MAPLPLARHRRAATAAAARATLRLLPLLAAALGCAPAAPATVTRGIIGGAVDPDDPAVVLLVSFPPDRSDLFTCTATLVAPTVALTAAHCVDAAQHPGHTFGVYLGADASQVATVDEIEPHLVAVATVVPHPQYQTTAPFTADIAVVVLAAPVAVAPLPLLRSAPDPLVASPARIVGYGQTSYGVFNVVKHAGTTTLAAVDSGDTITVGDATVHTCIGDSGGPALVSVGGVETVVGINSYSDTTGCTEAAHYRRVDLYLPFIDPFLHQSDGGVADAGVADAGAADGSAPGDAASGPEAGPADAGAGDGGGAADGAPSPTDAGGSDAAAGGAGGGCAAGGRGPGGGLLGLLGLGGLLVGSRRRR